MAIALFACLLTHQLAVLFSLRKNQQPVNRTFLSKQTSISHDATDQTNGLDEAIPNVSPSGLLVR
jgi:hypothetical protein